MTLIDAALDARLMVGRSVRRSVRDPEAFFTALALPVVLMLLFVYVFGGAMDTGGAYVDYVVPGLIVLCAGFGAGTTAVSVANDLRTGIVDRFRSMPVVPPAFLVGHVVASVARNLLATTLVVLVGLAVGWRPSGGVVEWLAAAALVTLYVTALSFLAAAMGLRAGSPEAAASSTMVLSFLPYLSSAFVPAATMPGWLQPIANHQPVTPVTETLRALWMGTPGARPVAALAWTLAVLALSAVAAARLFRRNRVA